MSSSSASRCWRRLSSDVRIVTHRVCADVDGVVTQLADEGGLVKDGEVIATVEPADAE